MEGALSGRGLSIRMSVGLLLIPGAPGGFYVCWGHLHCHHFNCWQLLRGLGLPYHWMR